MFSNDAPPIVKLYKPRHSFGGLLFFGRLSKFAILKQERRRRRRSGYFLMLLLLPAWPEGQMISLRFEEEQKEEVKEEEEEEEE